MRKWFIAALACCSLSAPAMAGVYCQGTVTETALQPEGTAYVTFGYGSMRLCEMNGNLTINRGPNVGGNATLTPVMCQALYSSFLTAKSIGKQVIASVDASSCPTFNGTVPNPYPYTFQFPQ
jgi:hypothetical protein